VTPVDKNNEPLDTVLRRAMRAEPGPATPECADATSLAAYSDRSLAAAERERLETHFADCMRCQLVLADIARADESARDARAESEVPWYRRWRIAIPALSAVGAILVFIAIRRPVNEAPQSNEVVAMAKRESPKLAAPEPAAAPEMPEAASAPPPAAPASAPAPPASNEIAMNEAKAPAAAASRAQAMNGTALHHMQRSAAPLAVPGAMFAQGAEPAAKTGAMQSYSAAAAGGVAAPNDANRQSAEVLAMISPPDRSVIWSVGKNGMILRLDPPDGRRHPQQSGVSIDLVAGAAASSSVCWVVGNGGTILRTTDGEHWAAVASPTTENLVAVSSVSAGDATVTTASSKSFVTSDGGVTWRQQ
jgi:hypothetical protein